MLSILSPERDHGTHSKSTEDVADGGGTSVSSFFTFDWPVKQKSDIPSSITKIFDFFNSALAKHSSCRCP